METPLISIIIPAYNAEKYISHCLDSILAQTYSNIEIIAVDDGSKDGTAVIIDRYAEEHSCVKAIHQANGGVTRARLNGVSHALGEYIGFVDSDDEIEADMYELLMGNALKYQADISHCGYQMVFPSRVAKYYGTGIVDVQDNRKGLIDLFEGSKIEPGLCNKLFRKTLFQSLLQTSEALEGIKNNEDLLINYYLFKGAEKSVFEDVCKYHYMVRPNSATTAKLNEHKLLDPLKVRKILLREENDDAEYRRILTGALVSQLVTLSTKSLKENPELIRPARKDARAELRGLIPEVFKGQSVFVKAKALWAAYAPTSYRIVHELYLKITGLDKKYEIN